MNDTASVTLALDGGPRAVPGPVPRRRRWGEPELARLRALVEQDSLFYWNGPQTRAMLEGFRRHVPLPHLMPCSSGTAALHIAVACLQLQPGHEVIVPAITDMGSVIGILYQQLVPVFADVRLGDASLDPDDVRRRLTSRTRAIIAVHLAGTPCDLHELQAIARQHRLRLIEDCAQSWGARWQGRPLGTVGDLGAWSFNDFKHLSCGDGGVVGTADPALGADLGKWGDKHYDRVQGGRDPAALAPNYRISEPQAAICAAQLERLEGIVARREALGQRLCGALADLPGIAPMAVREGDTASYWFGFFRMDPARFTVDRDAFARALQAEGVAAGAGYIPTPVPRYRVFQEHAFFGGRWPLRETGMTTMDYREVHCPQAEEFLATAITLPIHEGMDERYIDQVAGAIAKVARHYAR